MDDLLPGHGFRDTSPTLFGHPAPLWVVSEVFTGTDGVRYARVYSASDPHRRKTLSVSILLDKRRFTPMEARAPI